MEKYIVTKLKIMAIGLVIVVLVSIMAFRSEAQTPGQRARKETVDLFLFGRDVAICTKKEDGAQYLYSSKIENRGSSIKDVLLNQGTVNSIVGADATHTELFVYHRLSSGEEKIGFYKVENGIWVNTGERKLPALKNQSDNFKLFMTEDKEKIVISAQLSKTLGLEDIYTSVWSKTKCWSTPKSLGKRVNTRLSESALYLRENTLYFSRQIWEEGYVYSLQLKRFAKPQMIQEGNRRVELDRKSPSNGMNGNYARSNSFEIVRIK